jgi:cytochrome c-type biogenesis protein
MKPSTISLISLLLVISTILSFITITAKTIQATPQHYAYRIRYIIDNSLNTTSNTTNYYFYVYGEQTCFACKEMLSFLKSNYGEEHICFCDLTNNVKCYNKFYKLYSKGIPGYVPVTFIVYNCTVTAVIIGAVTDKGFIDSFMYTNHNITVPIYMGKKIWGYLNIGDQKTFINYYLKCNNYCPVKTLNVSNRNITEGISVSKIYSLMDLLAPLIVLALIDSVNPCTMIMYFTFILVLLSTRRSVLGPSILFLVVIYIGYFLLGFGLKILSTIIPYKILLILALVVAVYNMYEAGKTYGSGLKCEICDRLGLGKALKNPYLTSLILSLVSVTILLPCTSGPLMVFAAMLREYPLHLTIIALMLYNMIFITPLVLILVITILLGKREKVSNFMMKHMPIIEFLASLILLFITVYLLII